MNGTCGENHVFHAPYEVNEESGEISERVPYCGWDNDDVRSDQASLGEIIWTLSRYYRPFSALFYERRWLTNLAPFLGAFLGCVS